MMANWALIPARGLQHAGLSASVCNPAAQINLELQSGSFPEWPVHGQGLAQVCPPGAQASQGGHSQRVQAVSRVPHPGQFEYVICWP